MTSTLSMLAACAMLALAASLGVFQIITRFVLETPAEWSEVMIRFSLIWMVFLGIPTAFRQGAMVSVDVLYRWSPPAMRRVLDWVVCLAALVLIAVIIWWGWDYAQRGGVQSMAGLESVSRSAIWKPGRNCRIVCGVWVHSDGRSAIAEDPITAGAAARAKGAARR